MMAARSRPSPAPRHKKLLPCELGREAASKADADHTIGADLQGPILEIEGRAAEGKGSEDPDDGSSLR